MSEDPLLLSRLLDWTAEVAAQVRSGEIFVPTASGERWDLSVVGDDEVEIWVVSWPPGFRTELHDHGPAAGAFVVTSGSLTEGVWDPIAGRRVESRIGTGSASAFAPGHVHDVANHGTEPAVTVNAYSPPLAEAAYYDVHRQRLRRFAAARRTDGAEAPLEPTAADEDVAGGT